jgi:hypothetical protein
MKSALIAFNLLLGISYVVSAQDSANDESIKSMIKDLEIRETKSVVDKDIEDLKLIWAEDFMVNNPSNQVIHGRQGVFDRIESGVINYSSFEREIEAMTVLDDVVIVMGQETVMPIGESVGAGTKVLRRYTSIWQQVDGKWLNKARHANVICGDLN